MSPPEQPADAVCKHGTAWTWVQPADRAELLTRLANARDFAVPERERENLCSVAHGEISTLEQLCDHIQVEVQQLRAHFCEAHQPDLRQPESCPCCVAIACDDLRIAAELRATDERALRLAAERHMQAREDAYALASDHVRRAEQCLALYRALADFGGPGSVEGYVRRLLVEIARLRSSQQACADLLAAEEASGAGHKRGAARLAETAAKNLARAEQAEAERDALQAEFDAYKLKHEDCADRTSRCVTHPEAERLDGCVDCVADEIAAARRERDFWKMEAESRTDGYEQRLAHLSGLVARWREKAAVRGAIYASGIFECADELATGLKGGA